MKYSQALLKAHVRRHSLSEVGDGGKGGRGIVSPPPHWENAHSPPTYLQSQEFFQAVFIFTRS